MPPSPGYRRFRLCPRTAGRKFRTGLGKDHGHATLCFLRQWHGGAQYSYARTAIETGGRGHHDRTLLDCHLRNHHPSGGRVVFCDTDNDTFTIDSALIEAKITPRTVGIIPVHLYGQSADMDAIMAIAEKHKLWVIEDCAQAHLARFKGRFMGTFGNAATFSFYPGRTSAPMATPDAL